MKVKPKIGYFLSDNDFKTIPPGFWYGYYPCEFLLMEDYFQFYSLNYPNKTYKENSQKSNDFSPNHLRYIFPHRMSLEKYQAKLVKFIKTQKIKVIVAKQKTTLPTFINSILKDSIIDRKTGDRFLLVE